jgi:restriction system protein
MRRLEDMSEVIDTKILALEEWLDLLFNPPSEGIVWSWSFQTDERRNRYLETIDQRSEEDIYRLLHKFLIPSGSLGCDEMYFDSLMWDRENDPERYERRMRLMYHRRLFLYSTGRKDVLPWEGNTWILDLLPHFPKQALEGLDAYTFAHIQLLPDGRLMGQYDAASIIRAKFIGLPGTQSESVQFLTDLSPRDFECLVKQLYREMGYDTRLTTVSKDGGRDIIASKVSPGQQEHLRIECKRYTKPVGVGIIRSLLGVVSDEKVNKGVLTTTSRFTGPARKFADQNPRLELIAGDQLVLLMNEHLGPSWPLHIERLVAGSRRDEVNSKGENFAFPKRGLTTA